MGYNISIRAIKRVEPYLKALVESNANLNWVVPDAKRLAYYIHEGLVSAETLSIKPYDELRKKWKIRYNDRHANQETVMAELIMAPESMPSRLQFAGITDTLDIIQTIIKHKHLNFELLFPNATSDPMLEDYAKEKNLTIESADFGLLIKPPEQTNASS